MSSKEFDVAVFIGRMQPFHNGHLENIKVASKIADKVLILLGSCNIARDPRNPFGENWRAGMVRAACFDVGIENCEIGLLYDNPSNDIWAASVQKAVKSVCQKDGAKIAIVGHEKDETSFYLKLFPTWTFVETGCHTFGGDELAATKIRELMFEDRLQEARQMMPASVYDLLTMWRTTEYFDAMQAEYNYLKQYLPKRRELYPINDVTADAVVLCKGHILLIRRKNTPGKGLMALPGGFVQTDETVLDGAVRELLEETKLHVPEKVIRGSITDEKRFDKPNRSLRGRIMTFAFTIEIDTNPDGSLPRVYGSDDAAKAFWLPLSEITSPHKAGDFFEDHWNIIMTMIGRAAKH